MSCLSEHRDTLTRPNPTFLWNFQTSFFFFFSCQIPDRWKFLGIDPFLATSLLWIKINQDLKVNWLTVWAEKVPGFADQIQPHLPTTLPSPSGLACAISHFLENPNFNLIPKGAEPSWYCCLYGSVKSEYIPQIINHLNLTPINYRPWISFLSVLTSHNKLGHSVSVRHWSRHHWESQGTLWSSYVAGRVKEMEWVISSYYYLNRSHGSTVKGFS